MDTPWRTQRACLPLALSLALALAGCDKLEDWSAAADATEAADSTEAADATEADATVDAPADLDLVDGDATEPGPFEVRGTVNQVYIWRAPIETAMQVVTADGTLVAEGVTDHQGSLVLRGLAPATDLTVRLADAPQTAVAHVRVLAVEESQPDEAFYASQTLLPGRGYLTMRDGTQLSVFVSLPGPVSRGPYPTIVNYSGYSPSRPGEPVLTANHPLCGPFPILCDAPGHPAGLLAGLGGYASVGVNMRGTGCSGGAYDYFETLQLLDGYDLIEIVARQPWVAHHKVGMAGLSYPGISQLFVASLRPPSLAAIAPMSVIADTASSTLAPGGIYNDGFALAWIENVLLRALPYGHDWIAQVVADGDTVCQEHQLLHSQMLDVVQKALDNPYYTEAIAAPVDPSRFVQRIDVPVFLTGQWQDEQTGPHFATLLDKFTAAPVARFTVTNGVHADGYTPQILMEWKIFLDLYVAREVPSFDDGARALVPFFYDRMVGAPLELPPNRFEGYTSYAQALHDYEAEPPLRVIWESGADPAYPPGAPSGTFESQHPAWPLPQTAARRWYFQPDGTLAGERPPGDGGASSFHHDPDAAARTTLASGTVDPLQPDWDYRPLVDGKAVAFVTPPLDETLVMLGSGSVDLWLRSTATDADLEVHLTEVRPDGQETLVQSGWLRASQRALRDDASELRPVKTHREEDAQPLVPGQWTLARVELMPFGHIFRAGSRVRLSVDTPGDTCASWFFILLDQSAAEAHTIGHSADYPSSVALPVIPDLAVPTPLPDCGALRGQPCRPYVPLTNTPAP